MTAAAPNTWMPLWIGPYLANTLHLNRAQHGSYCLLIFACWKAGGRLPNNDDILATIARCTAKEWRTERPIFAAFFEIDADWWTHPRVVAELEKAKSFKDKQTQNGGKGGRPKTPRKTQPETQTKPRNNPNETHRSQSEKPNIKPNETTSPNVDTVTATESLADSQRENPSRSQGTFADDGGWEPEAGYGPAVTRGKHTPESVPKPLADDWEPSEAARQKLAKSRPDLTFDVIERRTVEFRSWFAEGNRRTHNPDASWLGFMVKTHEQQPRNYPTEGPGEPGDSATSAGIAAAFARRSVQPG